MSQVAASELSQSGTSGTADTASISQSDTTSAKDTDGSISSKVAGNNQWKYDVLDGRVVATTIRAVEVVGNWLPQLLHIGSAAREDERRRATRVGWRRRGNSSSSFDADEPLLHFKFS